MYSYFRLQLLHEINEFLCSDKKRSKMGVGQIGGAINIIGSIWREIIWKLGNNESVFNIFICCYFIFKHFSSQIQALFKHFSRLWLKISTFKHSRSFLSTFQDKPWFSSTFQGLYEPCHWHLEWKSRTNHSAVRTDIVRSGVLLILYTLCKQYL